MRSQTPLRGILRFGLFELDLEGQELRKGEVLCKLQPQPFKVLASLACHAGHVVTREDLRRELWGDETFVDFEQGLNYCIRQIRSALGDEAQKPCYIETLPRRGYRFIAPVEGLSEGLASPLAGVARARRTIGLVVALGAALLLAAATVLYFSRARPLTERDFILVADFANITGEPVFDNTLKQALAVKLHESPFLNVVPEQRVRETLRLMGHTPDEAVTPSVAREVCERQGIKAMVTGSITRLGSHYVIALEASNCHSGDSLAGEQVEASSKEQVLKALGEAVSKFRGKLGESLSSIQKFNAPIEEATTSSLEALKAFGLGETMLAKGAQVNALTSYEHAVELDPDFALAYGRLGTVYRNLGEMDRAAEYDKKAFERRERVSEREKLYISARYYWDVTGEIDKAMMIYELWKRTYVRDWAPHNNLAVIDLEMGQFDKAVEEGREAVRLNPSHALSHNILASSYLRLNRFEEAKATYGKALSQKLDFFSIHRGLYWIAFIQGDTAAMQLEIEGARGKVEEFRILFDQAASAAFLGKLQNAREISRHAVEVAQRGNFKGPAGSIAAWQALTEAEFGNIRQAQVAASKALQITRNKDTLASAAVAVAISGETNRAQALIQELARRFPHDVWINRILLPTARSAIEINRGSSPKAIELLEGVTPYELGLRAGFLPVYVRGQAYVRGRAGAEAAKEFSKILNHRGVDPTSPLYALAHLGLARAYSLSGDTAKSRRTYQDFLALWKDADPDIPILKEAKAEYAKLQ